MWITMDYLRRIWKAALLALLLFLSLNLSVLFLPETRRAAYLLYVDFLLLVLCLVFVALDYGRYRQREERKRQLLELDEVILEMLPDFENRDIARHEVQVLERQCQKLFDENCELQDYVARWSHEWKLPLAACLLMQERIPDPELKAAMREQLERMKGQMDSMLLGCKLQSALLDLQIRPASLGECVRTSVHNQQFFLIRNGFAPRIQVGETRVYTDPSWLVYILDQLIGNAIKYGKKQDQKGEALLGIWEEAREKTVRLYVEDHGEGIKDSDIRRIFEKGFTGSNCHNGKYRSTGMGLYMAAKIAARLGHQIQVESRLGEYTRFCILLPGVPSQSA